jgi:hypothetical protein
MRTEGRAANTALIILSATALLWPALLLPSISAWGPLPGVGILSIVHDRYQSHIMWLPALFAWFATALRVEHSPAKRQPIKPAFSEGDENAVCR